MLNFRKKFFDKTDPKETLEQIVQIYNHPEFDPDAQTWREIFEDKDFNSSKIFVVEIAKLKANAEAKQQYDSYLKAIIPVIKEVGGQVVKVNDILMPGTGDIENYDYDGGTSFIVEYPSRAAFIRSLLSEAYQEARQKRIEALAEVMWFIAKNNMPPIPPFFFKEKEASEIATPHVNGKTPQQLVDELLTIYPDGGADPSRRQLERMMNWEGFESQPVYYINLYKYYSTPSADQAETHNEEAHKKYNQGAVNIVRAHGARPYFRADVKHNLAGNIKWDLVIFVRWPSFKVFTDLRLDPEYIEAQKFRVETGERYGNFVNIARPDSWQ